jgi:hypothetical protein
MKKTIYLILFAVTLLFISCKDDSGKFEEQIFTNDQITFALRECIKVTSDSTLKVLCIVDTLYGIDGYSYHDSKAYRIELPAAAQFIDTLTKYGFGNAIDTLIMNINKAAEQCGNKIKADFLEPIIKDITFPNPNQILHGDNTAITDYVKATRQTELIALLKTSVLLEQFNTLKVLSSWNMLQEEYYKITETYISIDILDFSVQQMVTGFFKKMASVEVAVRKNPELRGDAKGWLYLVFKTVD